MTHIDNVAGTRPLCLACIRPLVGRCAMPCPVQHRSAVVGHGAFFYKSDGSLLIEASVIREVLTPSSHPKGAIRALLAPSVAMVVTPGLIGHGDIA